MRASLGLHRFATLAPMGSDEAQRGALHRFLNDHQPIDEQERVSLAAFIEQLDRLDRPFAEVGGLVPIPLP